MNDESTTIIDVELPGENPVLLRVTDLGGSADVGALDTFSLDEVADSIKAIADTLGQALVSASPKKATVEFGLELTLQSGKLISLITEAGGKATLKVQLQWGD
jgi:hypothetical protein